MQEFKPKNFKVLLLKESPIGHYVVFQLADRESRAVFSVVMLGGLLKLGHDFFAR